MIDMAIHTFGAGILRRRMCIEGVLEGIDDLLGGEGTRAMNVRGSIALGPVVGTHRDRDPSEPGVQLEHAGKAGTVKVVFLPRLLENVPGDGDNVGGHDKDDDEVMQVTLMGEWVVDWMKRLMT